MICVIAIFFCIVRIHFVFSVLLLRRQGEVGLPPRAHNRLFGYLSVGQLVASVFAELAAHVPRKMLVFEEIVINFAKEKEKKPHPPAPNPSPKGERRSLTPNPSPSGEGSD